MSLRDVNNQGVGSDVWIQYWHIAGDSNEVHGLSEKKTPNLI